MFEAAELGSVVTKDEYSTREPLLRAGLLQAQFQLRKSKIPVIVIISGADGAGKGDTVNTLTEWLDPRGVEVNAFGSPTDEERERPPFWRFWRTLPARGKIGIFFGSWYTDPIVDRVYGKTKSSDLDEAMARIASFEQMLASDGALILKFWFHLSKRDQRKRLEKLEEDKSTRWRVAPIDWKHLKLYDDFVKHSERALRATDTASAPWTIIDAMDDRHRDITVGEMLLTMIRSRLDAMPPGGATTAGRGTPVDRPPAITVLDRVDLTRTVDTEEYNRKLAKLQARVNKAVRLANEKKRSTVAVFEGWDAAGKGGAIRRLTAAMDARQYRVIPIAAPTDEERAHHYLWRFWRHIPRAGRVTIYDRSWYGRVLVERVEGFAREDEWMRSYSEINDFEEQLTDAGIIVMKYWVHISEAEQLRRFEQRQSIEYKQHKITEEDWRNREKWDGYTIAVNDMVARTSNRKAPWTLIPGNDKRLARLEILETFAKRLEAEL